MRKYDGFINVTSRGGGGLRVCVITKPERFWPLRRIKYSLKYSLRIKYSLKYSLGIKYSLVFLCGLR